MLKFLKHICQLLLSPGNGWEDISHSGDSPKDLAVNCLYPLFGLASITTFVQFFYDTDLKLVPLLQDAIIVFVKFFVTYFFASVIFATTLPSWIEGELNEKKYLTVITYSLAIMTLITVLQNCMPIELSLIYFLYVYVALVIWKSMRYLAVKEKYVVHFVIMAIVSVILPLFLINAIFDFIIK